MQQVQPSPFTESKDNMATTYEKIATTTLGSSAADITFSSIASSWTDLRVVFVGTLVSNNYNLYWNLNGDTSSLYSRTNISGNGSAAASNRATNEAYWLNTSPGGISSTIPSMTTLDLFSYAGGTFKTGLIEFTADYNGSGVTARYVGLYRSTSAITSIKISSDVNLAAGTTATLYGILKA